MKKFLFKAKKPVSQLKNYNDFFFCHTFFFFLLYFYCKWCGGENQSDFLLLCRKSNRYKINHLCFTCFEEERLWKHCLAMNLGFLLESVSFLESCCRGSGFVCFMFWCQFFWRKTLPRVQGSAGLAFTLSLLALSMNHIESGIGAESSAFGPLAHKWLQFVVFPRYGFEQTLVCYFSLSLRVKIKV